MGQRIVCLRRVHDTLRCRNGNDTNGRGQLLGSLHRCRGFWPLHRGQLQPYQHYSRRSHNTREVYQRVRSFATRPGHRQSHGASSGWLVIFYIQKLKYPVV